MTITVGFYGSSIFGPAEHGQGAVSTLSIQVDLSSASSQEVKVDYDFDSGNATPNQDFIAVNGSITFLPGETRKYIVVQFLGDDIDEQGEYLVLRLKNPAGAELVSPFTEGQRSAAVTVFLQDDDRRNPNLKYSIGSFDLSLEYFGRTLFPTDFDEFVQQSDFQKQIIGSGDLNNDGYDDIVVGTSIRGDPLKGGDVKDLVLFFDPLTRTFKPDPFVQPILDESRYPRRALIADFNGDGLNDLFIADTDEFKTIGGAPNHLYLQTKEGLTNASKLLPGYFDYTHGAITADFDRDGRLDILVLNSPDSKNIYPQVINKSYLLSFQSDGSVIERSLQMAVPSEFQMMDGDVDQYGRKTFFNGIAPDLNADGYPDLVLAMASSGRPGDTGKIAIFESTGPLAYGPGIYISPPTGYTERIAALAPPYDPNGNEVQYAEFGFFDVDGDGLSEIVAGLFNNHPAGFMWVNSYLQVIKPKGNGVYLDLTSSVLPAQYNDPGTTGAWPRQPLEFADLDQDGDMDLITGTKQNIHKAYPNDFWVFQGGQLNPWLPFNYYQETVHSRFKNAVGAELTMRLGDKNYLIIAEGSDRLSFYFEGFEIGAIQGTTSKPAYGTLGNDRLVDLVGYGVVLGFAGMDTIQGGQGNDTLDGGSGVDQAVYTGTQSDYQLVKQADSNWAVTDQRVFAQVVKGPQGDGIDQLVSMERLKFSDKSIAIDLDANAGNAARTLATVFGKDAVKNTTYAGIAISLFDQGMTKDQVSQVAIDAVFGANPKSTDVVKLLWKNLFDADIDASNLAYYSGLIDSKVMTAAQLTTVAADLDLTAQLIDLAGLTKTGWEYIPFGN